MKVSVIISTYNNPAALEKTLWGYYEQTHDDYEILIADDGSGHQTRDVIERARPKFNVRYEHIWHEDDGFRKSKILNAAIAMAGADYLIFTDGDCIPRRDFVAAHARKARPNYFISGGSHIDVPEAIHERLTEDDVRNQNAFDSTWLAEQGMDVRRYRRRLTYGAAAAAWMDFMTPRWGVLLGANASAWTRDVLAVNGFESSSTYGSDDKELGVRMGNNGVRSRRLKYSLICLHQAHHRPYSAEQIRLNKANLRRLKSNGTTWIENGVQSKRAA